MFLRRGLLFFAIFGLICTGEATAGSNANAVLSLDLIVDGGAGNQRDDGVTSGTISGQGTKIAVEVFATGVTTPLQGMLIEFDFDASVLTYVRAENSAFPFAIPQEAIGTNLAPFAPVTLPSSGFLARAEFTTAVDVTDREFSIGIKRVGLSESRTSFDYITTSEVIAFNAAPSPDFNRDGIVDLLDYGLFRNQWNTRVGGPNWDAKFDLHGDGVINLLDYGIFRDNWNKTFPVPPSDRDGDEEMVAIPDMNLRAAIEDALDKSSGEMITRSDMSKLTSIYVRIANISDLTGLEFAFNLTSLNLGRNSISDVSVLSNLTSLTRLVLGQNSISDVSALSDLTSLTYLSLSSNSISDVSALSDLTSLETLLLRYNTITDLSPLVANTGLDSGDRVDVRNNPLSATSINTHIPALQGRGVEVSFDPAPYLTPVNIPDANLRAVIEDSLGKASGETITRGEMASLYDLKAPNSNISDLTGLEFATGLLGLSLDNNTITDISPLSNLTSLLALALGNNTITDISPLSNLPNLHGLGLDNNTITDISPLSNLTNLFILALNNNSISDLSPLVANTGLGSGDQVQDQVQVRGNPLNATSINTHIPALQNRGVAVLF